MEKYNLDLSTFIMKYCNGRLNVRQLSLLASQMGKIIVPLFFLSSSFGILASTLRDLRRLDLIHNDIKQENLLISYYNETSFSVVLADFGIARILSADGPELYSFRGPPELCPPEMVRKYTPAADMWLTGTVLLSSYSGWSREKMRPVLMNMKQNFTLELTPETPPELNDLVTRMLHPIAEKRLSIIAFLGHPFIYSPIL